MLCQLSYRGSEAVDIVATRARFLGGAGTGAPNRIGVRDLAMIGFLLVWFLALAGMA